ncbi:MULTISPECIES: CDP-alcohol phosphatidyltransferase family protein [unclassified Treponema]|uniref:CDP-alcohol phosphatidyltransferase family protein n=1 Tax=unclassified Treponema TaxID=2638727 RepID=UPI0020A54240|nr:MULTISPECIES: CDP-alcohol phosphatidyltransferase family protein [unclassified Treponema]UTC66789.1 CDP-alcohol phosphatidyltransferase family protein [Treponema sp. OMZ 789]UTC69522.1 CDP-alcohol phosphatidyltransferase family protein [Treponema sp. OMZ 790]UTC72236.1 CDP-alcohol phosphatidyltransferase family protein [Treponema sp. OMZ 791]
MKKILINSLTLLRLPLSIIFDIVLFYEERRVFFCGILFSVIALTDFFDGKLARYYNSESKIGAVLDAGTDFFFIFTASYILYTQGLLPAGMIIIILIKFTEFCLTSYVFNKKLKTDRPLFFDKIGRFVAVILYAVPLIAIILHSALHIKLFNCIVLCAYITVGFLSAVSLYIRVVKIIRF